MSRSFLEVLEHRLLFAWASYARLVDQDAAARDYPNTTGKGVTVALIDTGVDYSLSSMGGGFGPGYKVIDGDNFVDGNADPMDTDGHGTDTAAVRPARAPVSPHPVRARRLCHWR
jgi:subtilisin family serine protease